MFDHHISARAFRVHPAFETFRERHRREGREDVAAFLATADSRRALLRQRRILSAIA